MKRNTEKRRGFLPLPKMLPRLAASTLHKYYKECWLQESTKIHGRIETKNNMSSEYGLTITPYDWVSNEDEKKRKEIEDV